MPMDIASSTALAAAFGVTHWDQLGWKDNLPAPSEPRLRRAIPDQQGIGGPITAARRL